MCILTSTIGQPEDNDLQGIDSDNDMFADLEDDCEERLFALLDNEEETDVSEQNQVQENPSNSKNLSNLNGRTRHKERSNGSISTQKMTARINRNAQRQFLNIKNKVESFQKQFGYESNFLLLIENNFIQNKGLRGPSCQSTGKVLVSGSGDLLDRFKNDALEYDYENMEVMKLGKTMKEDKAFLKDIVRNCVSKSKNQQMRFRNPLILCNSYFQN